MVVMEGLQNVQLILHLIHFSLINQTLEIFCRRFYPRIDSWYFNAPGFSS